MEEEVQRKLHFNSSLLKQEFSGRWKKIVEMLTPYEIIKDADLRKVTSLPDDREKVHLLLKILSRYKQCQRFVEILEQNGYSDVCQKIKETESQRETDSKALKDKTFVKESETSEEKTVAQAVEQALERNFEIFGERMEEKLEELRTQVQDGFKKWSSKFEENEVKYSKLQGAYADSRNKINFLTNKLQEQNLENHELKKENESLKNTIEEFEKHIEVSKTSDEVRSSMSSLQHLSEDHKDKGKKRTENVVNLKRGEKDVKMELGVIETEEVSRPQESRKKNPRNKNAAQVFRKKDVYKK